MNGNVAVVIPCYNYGQYVVEAVESALRQDTQAEVIVVDDGSTDTGTLAVLEKLRSSGVSVHHQSNKGLPEARNAGIELTSAEFVVCLDADDILRPAYCSSCLEVMKMRHDVGFVYATTMVFGDQDKLWSRMDYSGLHLLVDNYVPYSAMFRRRVWSEIGGFSEEMGKGYEDWDFWMSAVEQGWMGFHVPKTLFEYRKHGQSMLSTSNLDRRALKRLLHKRHRRLYSIRNIAEMMIRERFPLPRVAGALIKEHVLRPVLR